MYPAEASHEPPAATLCEASAVATTCPATGMRSPLTSAIIMVSVPEQHPFIVTICSGSLPEICFVQLFSKPHPTHESSTKTDPSENDKLDLSSKERMRLATVMSAIAIHSRLEIASLNKQSAITAVATISKLLSNDAFAAVV